MKGTPVSERYDPDVCVDCDRYGPTGGRVMMRQVTDSTTLPLCPTHADRRRATGGQTHGSQPPRRLTR